ncbi:MAG TPA: C25 family cysteine peptidase, partial [Blastocatellia bacterium]|nr:C25 family cysteine peptidase [Blastocatellia bacterium]
AWGDQVAQAAPRYWLEDIDLNGKSSWTGPISVGPKRGKAPSVEQSTLLTRIGLASAQMTLGQGSTPVERKAEIASITPDAVKLQTDLAGQPAVKLSIRQEGWYRITQRDLVAAGLSSKVDARNLQLYVDGRQVPMIVNGEQDGRFDPFDSIEFYGVALNSTSTNTHVYWLVAGGQSGARITATKAVGGQAAPGSFVAAVERKDRTLYFAGLRNGETENFFGPVVASTPVDQSLTLTNVASTSSPASLDVYLQGVTLTGHQAQVTLNGSVVGTVSFSGQERGKASFPIAQSQLREGVNSVQLIAQGGSTDLSLVDTVRVSYTHTLTADSNQLRAVVKGGQPVTIGGFTSSDVRVMDVTDLNDPRELVGTISASKNNSSITLTPPGSGARALLAFTGATAMSAAAKANVPSNWHEQGLQNDYVMITTQDLKSSLGPLKALRESQGLSVAVVDVEDLYDEFSFGNKSPQAIKDFLQFTRDNWRRLPRFVLFAGDSSYDPKNYLGYGDSDLVPTKLYDSAFMEAASDDWFVDFQGTGLPEIASGRLPVRTAAEARAVVGKILSYESSTGANSALLAADLNDGHNFAAVEASLRALLPGGMQVQDVVRGTSDDATVKSQILAAINQGKTIVNYNGHGSVNGWRANILTNEDAASLTNNGNLAFFVMMTCLNGYFDDPVLDSLAESLLKASGGAAAVWASAAVCEPGAQEVMNQELYRLLFSGSAITLGEAAARAKQLVNDPDVRRSWILFGDPAMHLK